MACRRLRILHKIRFGGEFQGGNRRRNAALQSFRHRLHAGSQAKGRGRGSACQYRGRNRLDGPAFALSLPYQRG